MLPATLPMTTVPAGTRTEVPNVNGPPMRAPVAEVIVTVYDRMTTPSSALGEVISGS